MGKKIITKGNGSLYKHTMDTIWGLPSGVDRDGLMLTILGDPERGCQSRVLTIMGVFDLDKK
jgi:hypothetical protein